MDMFGRFAYADSEEKAEGGSPLDPADAKRVAGAGEAEPEPDASLLPSGPAAEAIAANADVKLHRKTNYVRRRMKRLRKKHLFDGKKASRRGKAPKGKVIDGEHELYALTYGMMLGLRTSLVHVYHSWRKPGILHMDDFNAKARALARAERIARARAALRPLHLSPSSTSALPPPPSRSSRRS